MKMLFGLTQYKEVPFYGGCEVGIPPPPKKKKKKLAETLVNGISTSFLHPPLRVFHRPG